VDISTNCETFRQNVDVVNISSNTEELFLIPSAFSPNNDGVNDYFKPITTTTTSERISQYEFIVFNRWGEAVFTTVDAAVAWDGQANTNNAAARVYVWFMRATIENCMGEQIEVFEKGNVTLIK